MKTVVVVNPQSGGGRTSRLWDSWRSGFERHLGDYELALTSQPGDASHITREALRAGADRIVAVGGDGTNHEVVSGFFDPRTHRSIRPEARFGFLACGTGSDLARTLRSPSGIEAQLARIAQSPGRAIDLLGCHFQGRNGPAWHICINAASVGQGGDLVKRVGRWKRLMRGGLPFVLAGLEGALFVKPWLVQLRVDGGEPVPTLVRNLTICNGRFQGGGMQVAPQATIDDGQFELVGMGQTSAARSVWIGLAAYRAKMQDMPEVWHRTVHKAEVEPMPGQPDMLVELDGESAGRAPVTFETMPGALLVCA
jgi:diacylglycerol kinase (ATP)